MSRRNQNTLHGQTRTTRGVLPNMPDKKRQTLEYGLYAQRFNSGHKHWHPQFGVTPEGIFFYFEDNKAPIEAFITHEQRLELVAALKSPHEIYLTTDDDSMVVRVFEFEGQWSFGLMPLSADVTMHRQSIPLSLAKEFILEHIDGKP